MKTTRAFIAALVLGCLCSIVSADVAAHKADTSPAAHSDPTPPHPHPKAPAAPAAHDQTVATAAAVAVASSPKSPSTPSTTAPPVCGNGIIEHGEECDCGSPQECAKDPCCNAKTCKLNVGAQCSNQQECCDQCQFRPSTFICRSATSDCDAVEMCSGKSAKCPANKKTCQKSHSSVPSNATTSCGAELCTTRDLQCQSQSDNSYTFATSCATAASSCQMSCTDPTDAASHPPRCVGLLANFEDGTECGQGGVCSAGACTGDKSNSAFFKKNTVTFAIGGGCIVVAFFICFVGVICSRRRKRLQKLKERKLEDSYQMSETNDRRDLYRKSNIRIGLDPSDNGMVDVMMPYDGSQGSGLTRRPSAGAVSAKARAGGRSNGSYPPDSLMTEQEMALDLESDTNQRMGPSLSNWPAPPGSRERTGYFDTPPPTHPLPALNTAGGSKGKGMLQKSPSVGNHIVYVPPPLPPPAITTPTSSKLTGGISPYADEAMIVFPPESPPRPVNNGNGLKNPSFQQAPAIRIGEVATSQGPRGLSAPYDEPSFLDLNNNNNSLTVDRYRTDGKSSPAKDRTSVNSFFSGLALDEPTPESYSLPPILPEPSFASEEYVMPAPIARVIPVPTPRGASPSSPSLTTVTLPPPSSSSSTKPKSAYERQQEEIQVASCFAQDLGFEIVHPSPTGSPRHKAATPTGSRRL